MFLSPDDCGARASEKSVGSGGVLARSRRCCDNFPLMRGGLSNPLIQAGRTRDARDVLALAWAYRTRCRRDIDGCRT
jgi:hypothetical protein